MKKEIVVKQKKIKLVQVVLHLLVVLTPVLLLQVAVIIIFLVI